MSVPLSADRAQQLRAAKTSVLVPYGVWFDTHLKMVPAGSGVVCVAGRGRQLTPLMWGGSWLRQLRTAGGCHCTGAVVVIRSESRSSLLTSGAFCGRSETAAARPHLGDGRWPRSPNRRRAEKCRTLGARCSRGRGTVVVAVHAGGERNPG